MVPFSNRRHRRPAALLCMTLLAICPLSASAQQGVPTTQQPNVTAYDFNIPAQALDDALLSLARQTGVEIVMGDAVFADTRSQPLTGRLTLDQALSELLGGTGIGYELQPGQNNRMEVHLHETYAARNTGSGAPQLPIIEVLGNPDDVPRDEKGYNAVYDDNLATSYIGKTEIERYKGANPADLLNGIAGVFSGDARNSNALDPNIRGVQGPGRVPLTIDGTEQSITVWRGYNGATNRNYIDPNLIGGVQVMKGPGLERDVYTGVGGAVVTRTIGVDDIVKPGETFGAELKLEGSNGSVDPRVPSLHTGEDYRDIDGFIPGMLGSLGDPTLKVEPRSSSDNDLLSSDDYAYRLAVGTRQDHFDAMIAYAYRDKGNHFSGSHNAGFYSTPHDSDGDTLAELNPIRGLAIGFPPGDEVLNTSSEMESWLGKLTWKIDDRQELSYTLRDTESLYGEVMPSRIRGSGYGSGSGRIQWPLSSVDAQAHSLKYTWNPEHNQWIDFSSNFWFTDTRSDTYTAGGTPNYAFGPDDPFIINTALRGQDNERTGVTLSNKMALLDSLDLTLGGSWQYEKLRSDSMGLDYDPDSWNGSWSLPRAGRRNEWEGNLRFDWRPSSRLSFSAGARYSSYWAFDDYLEEQQKAGNMATSETLDRGRVVSWTEYVVYTQEQWDSVYQPSYDEFVAAGLPPSLADILASSVASEQYPNPGQQTPVVKADAAWYADDQGEYDRADNPCTNGELADVEDCTVWYEGEGGNPPDAVREKKEELEYTVDTTAEKKRGHAWTPFFSATFNITDYSRVYFRYSEAKRYPSMFESTVGFSANQNAAYDLEPEHTRNYELAFIQDLTQWVDADYADLKLTYYQHRTENVIERDAHWKFDNIEQQTIRGAELQARIDTGGFFASTGVSYTFENEVCDESSAEFISRRGERGSQQSSLYVDRCVQDGFLGGYLITQAIPELSANLSLGGRFLNRDLELGTRLVYYKEHSNKDLEEYALYYGEFGVNTPFTWGDLLTVDAYASYRFNEHIAMELTGTNLTDQYYVDPATRSMMAAPGRVFKLSTTINF